MTPDPIKKQLSDPAIPGSETEANSEAKVTLLKADFRS